MVVEHREFNAFGAIDQVFDAAGVLKIVGGLLSDTAFAGRTWDQDAGLYYNRARWYEPESGRFISEDPATDGNNWYAYAGNNPVTFVDPSGLSIQSPLNGLAGAYSSGIVSRDESNPFFPPVQTRDPFGIGNSLSSASSFSSFGGSSFSTSRLDTGFGFSGPVAPSASGIDRSFAIDSFSSPTNFSSLQNTPTLSDGGLSAYSQLYQNDSLFRNNIEQFEFMSRAQSAIQTGTPFEAFGARLAVSLDGLTGDFLPGGGEFQDGQVLFGQDSTLGQRALATGSLALSLVTLGSSPNAGSSIRAAKNSTHSLDELLDLQQYTRSFDAAPSSQVLGQFDTLSLGSVPTPTTKLVPNPGGRLGNTATRTKTQATVDDLVSRGFTDIQTEFRFRPGSLGSGKNRFADVVGRNPATGKTEIIQIGRTLKRDPRVPVVRERNALDDIIFSPDIQNFPNSTIRFIDVNRPGVIQP